MDPTAFIAENAVVIGDVEIGPGANIWFHSVVRGDQNYIRIGSNCSIQDASILHVEDELPLIICRCRISCHPKYDNPSQDPGSGKSSQAGSVP